MISLRMHSNPFSLKLLTRGYGCVGKTCMLKSYTTDSFPIEYVPTVFENQISQLEVDGHWLFLNCSDTAGQETYKSLRYLSYGQADVFSIVFSVIDPSSFENALGKWYEELQKDSLLQVPKIIVGNKMDLRSEDDTSHITMQLYLVKNTIIGRKATYMECSALTQVGLRQIFQEAVRQGIKYKKLKEAAYGSTLGVKAIQKQNTFHQNQEIKPEAQCMCKIM